MDDICRVDVYVRNMSTSRRSTKCAANISRRQRRLDDEEITKMTSPEYLIEINAIAVVD